MADVPDIPRPSQLWKALSPERRQRAAAAFWSDDNASMEQTEAVLAIANRIKFRVSSVVRMPREKKVRHLALMPGVSEVVAARLLVVYHLDEQRPMMSRFLDAAGLKHQDGLIEEEELAAPPADRLQEAVRAIAASHPPEDVALYLSTLVWQDPETWGGLAEVPESRMPAAVPSGP